MYHQAAASFTKLPIRHSTPSVFDTDPLPAVRDCFSPLASISNTHRSVHPRRLPHPTHLWPLSMIALACGLRGRLREPTASGRKIVPKTPEGRMMWRPFEISWRSRCGMTRRMETEREQRMEMKRERPGVERGRPRDAGDLPCDHRWTTTALQVLVCHQLNTKPFGCKMCLGRLRGIRSPLLTIFLAIDHRAVELDPLHREDAFSRIKLGGRLCNCQRRAGNQRLGVDFQYDSPCSIHPWRIT